MIEGNTIESLRQSYDASTRQMQALLEQQGRLRDAAESLAREAREAVEHVAEALCPGLVDDLRKASPDGLWRISTPDLAKDVVQDVKQRLLRLDAARVADRDADQSHDTLATKAAELERMVVQLTAELNQERRAKEKAQTDLALLQVQWDDAQRRLDEGRQATSLPEVAGEGESPPAGPVPDERLPEWMRKWKESDGYERDCDLLRLLAETGMARRSEAARVLAEMWGKESANDGSIKRMFIRCDGALGLIVQEEAVSETSGSSRQYLIRLTAQGRDACRLVLGLVPVESQLDRLIKRHKSNEHVLLNLEAGDLLRDAGYVVDLFPASLELPSGSHFAPDLMASLDGDTLYVEVERETRKNSAEWAQKWEIVYEATGGEIYVVAANKRARGKMRSDIMHSLGQRPLALYLTSVSEARGRGLRGHDVWIDRRGG